MKSEQRTPSFSEPGFVPAGPGELDAYYMGLALEQARRGADMGEVPVGAVAVWEGRVVAADCNRREYGKNALFHAELETIRQACEALGGWRLHKCHLYVTLEPCPMCAGAILNARIKRLVFGARDPKAGCFGSVCDFCAMPFNHRPQVSYGVREAECAALLSDFFTKLRNLHQK